MLRNNGSEDEYGTLYAWSCAQTRFPIKYTFLLVIITCTSEIIIGEYRQIVRPVPVWDPRGGTRIERRGNLEVIMLSTTTNESMDNVDG
jgi:hypothetical protein